MTMAMPPLNESELGKPAQPWRRRLHEVIFESDTRAGRLFDVALIGCILASVAVVMLESVASIDARWHRELFAAEMAFTLIFTIEYVLRLVAVRKPLAYARSPLGIIDLLSIAPTWLVLVVPGAQFFLTVRILRLLRIFRVLKLTEYLSEAGVIVAALHASRKKVSVFLFAVMMLDIKIDQLRQGFWKHLPLAATLGAVVVLEMAAVLLSGFRVTDEPPLVQVIGQPVAEVDNAKALGILLYTEYVYPIQVAAVILLVAMIAAIALTLRQRKDSKAIDPSLQVRVRASDRLAIVKVEPTRAAAPAAPAEESKP